MEHTGLHTNTQCTNTHPPTHACLHAQVCVSMRLSAAQHCPNQSERGRCGVTCCLLDASPPFMHSLIGINWVNTLIARLHVGKNKCWSLPRSLYLWRIRPPALSWAAGIFSYVDDNDHHPHLHMFLFPEVCHSLQVLGSPPQTGSCNPPLGPLRLEGGGSYLRAGKTNKV